MSKPKKTDEVLLMGRVSLPTASDETTGRVEANEYEALVAAVRTHLAYLEERGQHTSGSARHLAAMVKP